MATKKKKKKNKRRVYTTTEIVNGKRRVSFTADAADHTLLFQIEGQAYDLEGRKLRKLSGMYDVWYYNVWDKEVDLRSLDNNTKIRGISYIVGTVTRAGKRKSADLNGLRFDFFPNGAFEVGCIFFLPKQAERAMKKVGHNLGFEFSD